MRGRVFTWAQYDYAAAAVRSGYYDLADVHTITRVRYHVRHLNASRAYLGY